MSKKNPNNICESCGLPVTKDDETYGNAYDTNDGRMPASHVKCPEDNVVFLKVVRDRLGKVSSVRNLFNLDPISVSYDLLNMVRKSERNDK